MRGCIPNRVNANNTHRGSEVNDMKRTHGLDEREMELVKLLMADCRSTGDIQAKLKRLFAGTIEQMLAFVKKKVSHLLRKNEPPSDRKKLSHWC